MEGLRQSCRLCLKKSHTNVDALTTSTPHELPVYELVHSLFSFWIKPMDLSTVICQSCLQLVNQFYDFYNVVKNSQLTFNNQDYLIPPDDKKYIPDVVIDESGEKANDDCKTESRVTESDPDFPHEVVIKEENDHMETDGLSPLHFSDDVISDFEETEEIDKKSTKSEKKSVSSSQRGTTVRKPHIEKFTLDPLPPELFQNGVFKLQGQMLKELYRKFYNLQCDMCKGDPPKFLELTDLFEHYKCVHKTKGYVRCCNTQMKHLPNIKWHMLRHLQPSAFECPICKRVYCNQKNLDAHKKKHLPDAERPFKCDECPKSFFEATYLKQHKQRHVEKSNAEMFACSVCQKRYSTSASRDNHMKFMHSSKDFLCPMCGKKYPTKATLNYHLSKQHNPQEPDPDNKMQCNTCGLIFKTKVTLRIHQLRHQGKNLNCTLCDYKTATNAELKTHVKMKHTDVKPFACNYCDKRFKMKACAKEHEAQHTGERKYSCPYCPKTFVSSGNFSSHQKRMHPEERRLAKSAAVAARDYNNASKSKLKTPQDKSPS